MIREHENIDDNIIIPDLWLPLTSDVKDMITGNSATQHGSVSYGDKGAYFSNGAYLQFNNGTHNVLPPSFSQSMTFLCDFYNTSSSGHNAILVFQKSTSARFVSIIYNNRRFAAEKIGSGNIVAQWTKSIAIDTQYTNCGFTWDSNEKKLSVIVNGEIKATSSVSSLPDFSNPQILIGWADASSNNFKGWLKNVRFYNRIFNEQMLM